MKRLRKNDQVVIISGKHKGATGSVVKIDWKKDWVVVDKINMVKKHAKPSGANPDGGIHEKEAPIHISNVALSTKGKDGKPTKVKFVKEGNKKIRISKKTGKGI